MSNKRFKALFDGGKKMKEKQEKKQEKKLEAKVQPSAGCIHL